MESASIRRRASRLQGCARQIERLMLNQSKEREACILPPLLAKKARRLEPARRSRVLQPVFPELPVDCRSPVRIAVISAETGLPGADSRLGGLLGLLPPGSWIRGLCGSVNRCRVEGCGETWRDAAGVEAWFRECKPDILYYPALEDLEFGIHPVGWRQDLRISLRHVLVNAVKGPSTVHERLLVREMMMAVGDFWPGAPDDVASPLVPGIPEGLSWLVRWSGGAGELLRWKPRRAAKPGISLIEEVFDEAGRLMSPAGLARFLLGDAPGGAMNRDEGWRARLPAPKHGRAEMVWPMSPHP